MELPKQYEGLQAPSLEKIKWPIRLKITLPYLFLAIVVATGVTILFWRIVMENVDERFTNQLFEAGKLTSEAMVSIETSLAESTRLLSNTQGVADYILSDDAESLRSITMGIIVNNQIMLTEFIDKSGNLILAIRQNRNDDQVASYEYVRQGDEEYLDWKIVQEVLESRKGDFRKYSDLVQTEWGTIFYVAGAVRNRAQEVIGVTLVGIPISELTRSLREATLAQITIYDFTGQPIVTTFPGVGFTQPLDTTLTARILEMQDNKAYRRDSMNRYLMGNDLEYGEILGPFENKTGVDLGLIGTALIKNVLITATVPSRILVISLVTLTVLLIILIGINLSTLITKPLDRMLEVTQSVASGNLSVRVEKETNDELAVLAESFNLMIENLNQSHNEMINNYDSTLEGWVKILELRDKETSGHSRRVVELTMALAEIMDIPKNNYINLRRGVLLHDIGKLGIPDSILLKKGPLTPEEKAVMRKHPIYAYEMLKSIPYLSQASDVPLCHHEWWNGKGYPRQLIGESIPLEARVFAIVDAWDALTTDRPYRKRVSPGEALIEIVSQSGQQFDPALVDKFKQYIEVHFLGKM